MTVHDHRLEAVVTSLLAQGDRRIIAGPWLGEVGWELLYWIPILRWCVGRWPELKERLVVVSRGGVDGWYEGVATTYVDVFEAYDEQAYHLRLEADRASRAALGKSSVKQREVTDWEQEIAARVSEKLGESPLPMLHPSVAFRVKSFAARLADAADSSFARLQPPGRGPLEAVLPERYVALRFSRSRLFLNPGGGVPSREQLLAKREFVHPEGFVEAVTRFLAERVPVVWLYPGMNTDPQHPEFVPDTDVIPLAPHASFQNNLALQSIAIANATAFVGNYGGLSLLPPHYGVPSICFWSTTRGTAPGKGLWRDLDLATRVFNRPGWGRFTAGPCDAGPLEELLVPALSGLSSAAASRRN